MDGTLVRAKVMGRTGDMNGNLVGAFYVINVNPMLNTRVYLAAFPDGHIKEYNANMIIEAIYNNANDDGNDELLFAAIIEHESDKTAMKNKQADEINQLEQQGREVRKSGNKHPLHITKGWFICVAWKDGSSSWHSLANIKNSHPIQLADYAINNNIKYEPICMVGKNNHEKHNHFIKAAKRRLAKKTHKFHIGVPQTVEEALKINAKITIPPFGKMPYIKR
jgi:hypothetical protein